VSATERRDLIVQAAINLFARQGFRATRVIDIAQQVGTSDALVFQHFPTKRDLYNALLERVCTRKHFTELEQLLYYTPEYSIEEAFTRLSVWFIEQTEAEPEWLRLILYAALEQDEAASDLVHEHFQRVIDYVGYEIGEGQVTGRFRIDDRNALAREFFAGLLGLALMRAVARNDAYRADDTRTTAAHHVRVFLQGIESHKEKP